MIELQKDPEEGKEQAMADKSICYKAESEMRALETLYGFLSLSLLTDPECFIITPSSYLLNDSMRFSRIEGNIPPTLDAFRRAVSADDWEVILCMAGTEPKCTRRALLLYVRAAVAFGLNFPDSRRLTRNESAIREWVRKSITEG